MDENTGSAKTSEWPSLPRRMEELRVASFRERELPSARIMKTEEHYVVHVGCKMGVFHTARGVEDFLHRLLTEWVNDTLGDDAGKDDPQIRMVAERERL